MKALRHGSKFDVLSSTIVFIGYSIPGYALGILLLYYFGGDYFPIHGWRSENWIELSFFEKIWDQFHHAAQCFESCTCLNYSYVLMHYYKHWQQIIRITKTITMF